MARITRIEVLPYPSGIETGKDIKEWRKACGISIEKASKVLGLSFAGYCNYEYDRRVIPHPIKLACEYLLIKREEIPNLCFHTVKSRFGAKKRAKLKRETEAREARRLEKEATKLEKAKASEEV